LLKAPQGPVEAYKDYALLAEQRLTGESLDAANERLEALRAAVPSTPKEVRDAYSFVTRAASDGTFASAADAQCRLVEGYLLRGRVADAIAHALAALPNPEAGGVTRDEERVRLGSVWVSRKRAEDKR
jgi:hypothetical protein